jgi:hypothetical protein
MQRMVRTGWMGDAVVIEPDDIQPIAAPERQGRVGPDRVAQGPADQFERTTRLVGLEQIARQCQQYTQLARASCRASTRFFLIAR